MRSRPRASVSARGAAAFSSLRGVGARAWGARASCKLANVPRERSYRLSTRINAEADDSILTEPERRVALRAVGTEEIHQIDHSLVGDVDAVEILYRLMNISQKGEALEVRRRFVWEIERE